MIAFASNSLLCRAALKQTSIDAATFTFIRIFSGAVALWLIMKMRNASAGAAVYDRRSEGNWLSAAALRLRRGLFICLQHSLCRHGRVAFIWRGSGHDGSLGLAQR